MGAQGFGWGVVETRANSEGRAERALIEIGYSPLVVRYNKLLRGWRSDASGRQIRSRQDSVELRPFIPGYLFLPIPDGDDATLVDGAQGVRKLFRQRDAQGYLSKPKIIRARVVEQIIAGAVAKDETPKKARDDLAKRIAKDGVAEVRQPNTGMVLYLTNLDDKGRADYFTTMMGGEVRGRIEDTAELELVDS